jgi:hypothetical protein
VRLVVARGGGRALGLLERDPGRVYAGLLLDHDLQAQAVNDAERNVTGTQVVQGILHSVDPEIPILICQSPSKSFHLSTSNFFHW